MHHNNECGCGHHPHQGHGGMAHHGGEGVCCCAGGFQGRHFYTKEEMITHLENYLKQLQAEVKGLEEHISQLKADKQ